MEKYSFSSRALRLAAWAAFGIGARVSVLGRENIPAHGPVIIAANHTHNMDPALIGMIMPWPMRFLAKRDLVTGGSAASRWIVNTWGVIPISRERLDREALRYSRKYLQDGGAIGMFPEGTRSRDGRLGKAMPGTAFLAVSSGAPILPIGIEGFVGMSNSPMQAVRRQRATMRIGPPVSLSVSRGKGAPADMDRATEEIMRAIAELLPEHMRGDYGESSDNPAAANMSES